MKYTDQFRNQKWVDKQRIKSDNTFSRPITSNYFKVRPSQLYDKDDIILCKVISREGKYNPSKPNKLMYILESTTISGEVSAVLPRWCVGQPYKIKVSFNFGGQWDIETISTGRTFKEKVNDDELDVITVSLKDINRFCIPITEEEYILTKLK